MLLLENIFIKYYINANKKIYTYLYIHSNYDGLINIFDDVVIIHTEASKQAIVCPSYFELRSFVTTLGPDQIENLILEFDRL